MIKRPGKIIPRSEIPPLEIVSEQDSTTRILELFQHNKDLAVFQISEHLGMPYATVDRVCRALVERGKLSRRYATVKHGRATREMAVYSSQTSKKGA